MKGDQQREHIIKLLDKIIPESSSPALPVSISDGADVTQGAKADAQATDATSSWSVIALLKGLYTRLGSIASTLTTAAKGATVAGSPTSRSKSADVTALDVQIVDASGNPIVTFGTSTPNVQGVDIDNAVQTANKPVPVGGKAVDPSTYAPAYTVGDVAQAVFDKDTGAMLVSPSNLSEVIDFVTSYLKATSDITNTVDSYRNTALNNTKASIKSSAGNLYGYKFINTNTNAVFVHLYDATSASVTVGVTVPVSTIVVPGGTTANPGVVYEFESSPSLKFVTAITIAATANQGDSDATALGTAIQARLMYK